MNNETTNEKDPKLHANIMIECHNERHVAENGKTINVVHNSVSQPPGRGPVPGSGINYTGPQEVLLEFVILVF